MPGMITGKGNKAFKDLLAAKKDKGLTLLEGRRLVTDALGRGMKPGMVAATPEYIDCHGPLDIPHTVIAASLFERVAETKTPQGILAFFPVPWATLEEASRHDKLVILDGLQDPGNVGTIIRTAEAFGFKGVLVTQDTASPFSSKAVRSSMGSSLGVSIAKICRDDLKHLPHRIVSLALHGGVPLSRDMFEGRTAVCLGQEGAGVSPEILGLSQVKAYIPMQGEVESLNVSIAAGIVMAYAGGALDGS